MGYVGAKLGSLASVISADHSGMIADYVEKHLARFNHELRMNKPLQNLYEFLLARY